MTGPRPQTTRASSKSVSTNFHSIVPRQWGGCWLALELYGHLGLDTFFAEHLPASRKGTRWDR